MSRFFLLNQIEENQERLLIWYINALNSLRDNTQGIHKSSTQAITQQYQF
jgi:hypothetical protein